MSYALGLDVGGTKTESVLTDIDGSIIFHSFSKGGNLLDVGFEAGSTRILDTIKIISDMYPGEIGAICVGAAGNYHFQNQLYDFLRAHTENAALVVFDDCCSLLPAVAGHRDGCGMVAGTGSSLFAKVGDVQHHIGGWGYLLDTGGSGYDLSRDAIVAVLRAEDGRGEQTVLTELLSQRLGGDTYTKIKDIYSGGRVFIASLVSTVFEARRLGDSIATQIVDKGIGCLAELVNTAARYYSDKFPVAVGGGLFSAFPEYLQLLGEAVTPMAELMRADVCPVYGCIVEAMLKLGISCNESFRENFYSALAQNVPVRL